jgi:hypothetical protein
MRIALILLLATASASAGELYKCKSPTGEVTFTNIKCPEKTEVEHYGSYVDEPNAPPPVEAVQPQDPAPVPQGPAPMAAAPAPNAAPAGAQPVAAAGYQCSANGKTWIQASPCPATSTKVPVQQSELSKDEMCAMIAMRASTSEKDDNGPSTSDERDRLRAALDCA